MPTQESAELFPRRNTCLLIFGASVALSRAKYRAARNIARMLKPTDTEYDCSGTKFLLFRVGGIALGLILNIEY